MPPFYDIYGLSRNRDKETIEKFLNFFCFRDKVEKLVEVQGIFIEINELNRDSDIFIPMKNLSEVIEYGIKNPNQAFVFYLNKYFKNVKDVILCFTYDKQIIFGISVEENSDKNGELINNSDICSTLSETIIQLTSSHKTIIDMELPPPRSEKEFDDLFLDKFSSKK